MTKTLPLLLVVLGMASLGQAKEDEAEASLVIAGRVVDDAGKAVVGYTLWAQAPRGAPREFRRRQHGGVTDEDGRFRIEGLIPGVYQLHSGKSETHAALGLRPTLAGAAPLALTVLRYRVIEGVALDPDGEPLSGATITAAQMPLPSGKPAPTQTEAREFLVRSARTDAAGRFRIERYPSRDRVQLTVHPPLDRVRALRRGQMLDVKPGGASLTVVAPSALVVAGHVREEDGKPVAGITVESSGTYTCLDDRRRKSMQRSAVTDADGRFELRPFEPGETVYLTAAAGGRRPHPDWFKRSLMDVEPGTLDADIVLRRTLGLSGELVGVPAAVLRGLEIHASADRVGIGGFRFDGTTTKFYIPRMPRKKIQLGFRAPRRHRLVLPDGLEVKAPKTGLQFQVARGLVLRGVVTSRLEPHRIRVTYHDAWGRRHSGIKVREDRTFEIPGVPPGPGFLHLTASAGGRSLVREDADPEKPVLVMTLGSARKIRGRILGLPEKVRRGRVTARRGPLSIRGDIAADGWFETPPLAPGPWRLDFEIDHPRGVIASVEKAIAGGDAVQVEWGEGR